MKILFFRRRNLGKGSTSRISGFLQKLGHDTRTVCNGLDDFDQTDFIPDLIIRWGCTASLPIKWKGIRILNNAKEIHKVNNNLAFRLACQKADINIPYTVEIGEEYLHHYPCVVRPAVHAQGRHTYLCNSDEELNAGCNRVGGIGYISEYIKKEREVRVFIVQGRVVCVANKIPADPTQVCWNVAQGGRFEVLRWDRWPLRACVEACRVSQRIATLDFMGVDVMLKGETAFVLEANSACSITSPYRAECIARGLDATARQENPPSVARNARSWRDVIHPVIQYKREFVV